MDDLDGLAGKTVLVTGAGGMLGRAFAEVLAAAGARTLALSHERLDVTDRRAVLALATERPDVIVHCAANVNADWCEEHPEGCRAVQVGGAEAVAELALGTGARVFYPQSFLIFDGGESPITETTPPRPLSVYGRCKLEAETLLRERLGERLLAVRMAGFFGGDEKDKNFVGKFTRHLKTLLAQRVRAYEVGDRVWQPTYTLDLARNSALLLARGKSGVYNMAARGQASFHELAQACVAELGFAKRIAIVPVAAERIAVATDKARRPAAAIMENRRLAAEGLDRQRPWRAALADYLRRPWFKTLFAEVAAE